jgi:hypothetical protein
LHNITLWICPPSTAAAALRAHRAGSTNVASGGGVVPYNGYTRMPTARAARIAAGRTTGRYTRERASFVPWRPRRRSHRLTNKRLCAARYPIRRARADRARGMDAVTTQVIGAGTGPRPSPTAGSLRRSCDRPRWRSRRRHRLPRPCGATRCAVCRARRGATVVATERRRVRWLAPRPHKAHMHMHES